MTDRVETYEYDKDRRYSVDKGTRCAFVALDVSKFKNAPDNPYLRIEDTRKAIAKASKAWQKKWGPIPWDLVQVLVTHVTMQVCVEFRVME